MARASWLLSTALILSALTAEPTSCLGWDASVSVGLSFPGSVEAKDELATDSWTYDLDKPIAPLIKVALDLYPLAFLGGGIFAYYGQAPFESELNLGTWDGRDHTIPASGIGVLVIGGCIKGRFAAVDRLLLKPSIGWSYLHTFSSSPDARAKGFVVNVAAEAEYPLAGGLSAVAELGVAAQPYGGVEGVAYITFGPIFYATIGLQI